MVSCSIPCRTRVGFKSRRPTASRCASVFTTPASSWSELSRQYLHAPRKHHHNCGQRAQQYTSDLFWSINFPERGVPANTLT